MGTQTQSFSFHGKYFTDSMISLSNYFQGPNINCLNEGEFHQEN